MKLSGEVKVESHEYRLGQSLCPLCEDEEQHFDNALRVKFGGRLSLERTVSEDEADKEMEIMVSGLAFCLKAQ